ncbi:UDP-glucose dehydrogenase family protein [Cytobacillus gottheilii]|uniref:UDP-glucose 6-dehydrogenase n=1 Tax=Cytobacillus gottheilii TaxID=859144 RepID=A0ABX8FDC3_9BACI|nr:UDP-glucose/GDP-mannose dehydrogenase family protein [Cytobacillus gottheilii]QVY62160.1 UDP-glucose/GDP-mannose dehydrogenase family protein [Cytobacillus gottheilii]
MRITVVGTGYVGLITSICLCEMGHAVTNIDIDDKRIAQLKNGRSVIYEPGLQQLLENNLKERRLFFTIDPRIAYAQTDLIFIAVGTPENPDGTANLEYLQEAVYAIASHIEKDVIICTKSTVPVGTNEKIAEMIKDMTPTHLNVSIVSNPEFLREGSAINDFFLGDRIVIGTEDEKAAAVLQELYAPLNTEIMVTDTRSAEMIKYASNAFLATKISFINEIAAICEKVGADISQVADGIGKDKRIGSSFLKAGIGYGGSCFPKDTKALVQLAGHVDHPFELLEAVIGVNNRQHTLAVAKAKEAAGELAGKRIALLGLAFKPNTDDIREAPSLTILKMLIEENADVIAYDPAAVLNIQSIFGNEIQYTENINEALKDADLAIIATEWDQIIQFPLVQYEELMKTPLIIDGRNCYSLSDIERHSITYISVGRSPYAQSAIAKV